MKKAIVLLVMVAAGTMLTACNTMHGFGKDVEKVGEKVQEKSAK